MPKPRQRLGYERLIAFVAQRRAPWVIALLAFSLTLPAIAKDMSADDYTLAGEVHGDPLGAYAFELRDPLLRHASVLARRNSGYAPWWVAENYHLAFWRPLASLSLALDFDLWPNATWWMIVENALLFAGVILLVAKLYRELGLAPSAAGFATFIYALKPDQAMSTGWIAGRNTLMAAAFGLLALLCFVRAQRPGLATAAHARWSLGAVAAYACALLSAELGLSTGAFLLAHACTLQHGPLRRRLVSLWPYALVVVGWHTMYKLLGYGSAGSGFYIEPGCDLLPFLRGVLTGIPIYLATQLTMPFASLSCISDTVFWIVFGAALIILALLYKPLAQQLRASRVARFFALGAALAAVPLGSSLPLDRLVYFIGFGTCGLISLVVTEHLGREHGSTAHLGARFFFLVHAVLLPLLYIPMMYGANAAVLGGGATVLERALPRDGERDVVLVNGPSYLSVTLERDMRQYRGVPTVPAIDMLYAGSAAIVLRRLSERVLEVEVPRGYLANAFERVFRDPARRPFREGDVVELPRMRVIVLHVNASGAPTRVRFELAYDPTSSHVVWLRWLKSGPAPWRLPAIGGSVELPGIAPI